MLVGFGSFGRGSDGLMTAVICCESAKGDTGGLANGFSGLSSRCSGVGRGDGDGE